MKRIIKNPPPGELIAWLRSGVADADESIIDNWGYEDIPGTLRQIIHFCLIDEQGHICCYTGRRITVSSSHIEHLKPQKHCENHEDTEYRNLLAAYPGPNSPRSCPYGAHRKKDWFDPANFVDPLREDVEKRFRFRLDGKIEPANATDHAAAETIRRLRLDHDQLSQLREAAIWEMLIKPNLSKAKVERLIDAMDRKNGNGQYFPFCFAIKQACAKYLKRFG